jgi:hypothetical protein|tara:strand:- start:1178 stop:1492 length:315 start_codon:yes stop_codon:yes gene_type:complete
VAIIEQTKRVEQQVERWDLYARIAPTVFLVISALCISFGIIDFNAAFFIGIGLFAVTAVTWWFWTIYTIKHLVNTLNRASTNLLEVREEFTAINKDIRDFKNEG